MTSARLTLVCALGAVSLSSGCERFVACEELRACELEIASEELPEESAPPVGETEPEAPSLVEEVPTPSPPKSKKNTTVGSGGGAPFEEEPEAVSGPPAQPRVTLSSGVREISLTWPALARVTHYQLMRKGDAGFAAVGERLSGASVRSSFEIASHLFDWGRSVYRLEACNEAGCSQSADIDVSSVAAGAIGYFKPSSARALQRFGAAVALSGDGKWMAVGALRGACSTQAQAGGAVYVFQRLASGWTTGTCLSVTHGEAEDKFGFSVSLNQDGSALAVGAPGEDGSATTTFSRSNNEVQNSGAVYLYNRSDSAWSLSTLLKSHSVVSGAAFGHSVSLSGAGDRLAVGAPRSSGPVDPASGRSIPETGSVDTFALEGFEWKPQEQLFLPHSQSKDQGGYAVALSGNGARLVVGAPGEDNHMNPEIPPLLSGVRPTGVVAVYRFTNQKWIFERFVKAGATTHRFGSSVAVNGSGNAFVVGAPGASGARIDDEDAELGSNSRGLSGVYRFVSVGGSWQEEGQYTGAGQLGSVALSADGLSWAVGAATDSGSRGGVQALPYVSDQTLPDSGAARVFRVSGGVVREIAVLKAPNPDRSDGFSVVAMSGDAATLVVGASGESSAATGLGGNRNDNTSQASGAVYLY